MAEHNSTIVSLRSSRREEMRSPLALLEVSKHDTRTGRNTREWVVVRTADAARGSRAHRIVFVRDPTPEERDIVELALYDSEASVKIHSLKLLLEKSWMYDDLCK